MPGSSFSISWDSDILPFSTKQTKTSMQWPLHPSVHLFSSQIMALLGAEDIKMNKAELCSSEDLGFSKQFAKCIHKHQ